MAIIQSGNSATLLTIDGVSLAARTTLYDANGNVMSNFSSLNNILNALNDDVSVNLGGQSTVGVYISGTTGTLTLTFEATIDGISWFSIQSTPLVSGLPGTPTSTVSTNGIFIVDVSGFSSFRAKISAITSGSMTVSLVIVPGQSKNIAQAITVAGTLAVTGTVISTQGNPNSIGNSWPVKLTNGATTVGTSSDPIRIDPTGTTIQPVSISGTINANSDGYVTISSPTYINNTFNPLSLTSDGALRVDGSSVIQPISGTIVANAGTGTFTVSASSLPLPSGAATEATLTTRLADSTFTDRINTLGQKTMSASTPVVISSDQTSFPVSGSGSFTVVQSTAANLNATVSGTIIANIGTSGSLALDATVSGLHVSQGSTTSGQKGDLILGAVTTTAPTYTTAQTNPISLTTSGLLRVDGSGTTQPISGTITANAGTGTFAISAAALPLPSGAATETTLNTRLADATFTGRINTQGQKTMSGSTPVVIASDQSTLTVSGTVTSNIGTTNGLALDTSINGILLTQGSTTSGQKGNLIQGAVSTASPSYTTAQTSPLSLTTAGALRTDSSATTQPISGTITANAGTGSFTVVQATAANLNATVSGTVAATQSGIWTVQPGNTANTTPWLTTISQGGNSATVSAGGALKVDNSAVTQPVSGTVTANAGTGTFTVSGTVTSNIGTTNGLALDATVSALQIAQSSTTSGQKGGLILGAVTTAAPTYTTAQSSPLSLTTTGAVRIDGSATTQPVSGTVTANAGSGTFAISAAALPLPSGAATETTLSTRLADATFTGRINTLGQKTAANSTPIVIASDQSAIPSSQSGTWTVQPGNTANTTPWLTTISQGGNSATVTASSALKIDGSAVTQPVSGTITSNQGTANTAANAWPAKITDGTNTAAVKAASTSPVAADPAVVVVISPNSTLPNTATTDAGNSSTSTLTGAAVFTGTGSSTLGYSTISVSVMAIGASAPPGTLSIQQSSDNTNWDLQDNYSVTGGTASPNGSFDIAVNLKAKFYRVVYTNGATAQTAFRLQTLLYPIFSPMGNAPTQKGIQGQSFAPVQQPKDTGRVVKIYEAVAAAVATTEGMLTLTPLTDFTAGSTGTSFTVTSGKKFRIQTISAAIRTTAATACGGMVKLRISSSGAVTTSTALTFSIGTGATAAAAGAAAGGSINVPDGLELSGTLPFGFSAIGALNTALWDVTICGYEY